MELSRKPDDYGKPHFYLIFQTKQPQQQNSVLEKSGTDLILVARCETSDNEMNQPHPSGEASKHLCCINQTDIFHQNLFVIFLTY